MRLGVVTSYCIHNLPVRIQDDVKNKVQANALRYFFHFLAHDRVNFTQLRAHGAQYMQLSNGFFTSNTRHDSFGPSAPTYGMMGNYLTYRDHKIGLGDTPIDENVSTV